MAAPKKPKSAGARTGKAKTRATGSGAVERPATATGPVPIGNGGDVSTAEMIRLRAYEIFVARDGNSGDEVSDWLTAEREIMDKIAPQD